MPAHQKRDTQARRTARGSLERLGAELRQARVDHDLSQADAARAIGRSGPWWSRVERGTAESVGIVELARALAVVGLDLHVRAYPGGSALRDRAHLALLERFRQQLGPSVGWRTEVPLPNPGDRRSWDGLVRVAVVRIGVEAETRAGDAQALQRRLAAKRRDGGVDHVILVLADTRHNRAFLRAAGEGFAADFPIGGKRALRWLAAGQDPRGSAIVLL
jgi:transcriptional regulator with XRE-family HTH domain